MRKLIVLLLVSAITPITQTPPAAHNYEFANGTKSTKEKVES
jgi:hypothetical protein